MMLTYTIVVLSLTTLIHFQLLHAQEAPKSPKTVYAHQGRKIEIPCKVTTSGRQDPWVFLHGGESLRRRKWTYKDNNRNTFLVIPKVSHTDAGDFSCLSRHGTSVTHLIVLEVSKPIGVQFRDIQPTQATMTWLSPSISTHEVRGYTILITEAKSGASTNRYDVNGVSHNNTESYTFNQMTPGSRHLVQISAKYPDGDMSDRKTRDGPPSDIAEIIFPHLPGSEFKAQRVSVEPWRNGTALVKWRLTGSISNINDLTGFKVSYQGDEHSRGEVTVTSSVDGEGTRWQTVLRNIPTRVRYSITVAPVLEGFVGPASSPVTYRHEGFKPELSIRATTIDPETALVSYSVVGDGKLSKLRILYSDDTATKWTRIRKVNTKERYVIVNNLKPMTVYYFAVKARVGKRPQEAVTHIITPPTDISKPNNVKVKLKSQGRVEVTWKHYTSHTIKGYAVKIEQMQPVGSTFRSNQDVACLNGNNSCLISNLDDTRQYRVRVTPYDLMGAGLTSEPIVIDLSTAAAGLEAERPSPPVFDPELTPMITVPTGENVELVCAANGNPMPTLRWFADSVQVGLPSKGRNVLQLEQLETTTDIVCRADNVAGVVSASTRVEVIAPQVKQNPPEFDPEYRPQEVYSLHHGFWLEIPCVAHGDPEPQVSWWTQEGELMRSPAQGQNTLVLDRVEKNMVAVCRAENDFGVDEITTLVDVIYSPIFVGDNSTRRIQAGESVTIPCIFEGNPIPNVTVLEGGTLVETGRGFSIFTTQSVEESFTIECVASNFYGEDISKEIRVQVEEPDNSTAPVFEQKLQSHTIVNLGDHLQLECSAKGEPTPNIEWSLDGMGYGETAQGRSVLKLDKVEKDMGVICRASNKVGVDVTYTIVQVARKSQEPPTAKKVEQISVRAYFSYERWTNTIHLRWIVDKGNLSSIRGFNAFLYDQHGGAIDQKYVHKDMRDTTLGPLNAGKRYRMTLQTITDSGVVDEEEFLMNSLTDGEMTPQEPGTETLVVDILEVRSTEARLEFKVTDPSDEQVKGFRLRVGEVLDSEDVEYDIYNVMGPTRTHVIINRLKPLTLYKATLDEYPARTDQPILTKSVRFMSGAEWRAGTPVLSTLTARLLSNSAEHSTGFKSPTPSSSSPSPFTGRTGNPNYSLAMRVVYRDPEQSRMSWSVNNGELDKIKTFRVVIEKANGERVIGADLGNPHRSITVTALSPKRRYVFTLLARDANDTLLVENQLEIPEYSDSKVDCRINLQANEIRSDRAQLDWILQGFDNKSEITGFRIRIQDSDSDGFEMMSKDVSAESTSLLINGLLSKRRFYATAEVLSESKIMLKETVTFWTPEHGKEGNPVMGEKLQEGVEPTKTSNDLITSTESITSTLTPSSEATVTDAKPPWCRLETKIERLSPENILVSWDITGEDLGDVDVVRITVSSASTVLLREDLSWAVLNFKISGLFPNKIYVLEVQALSTNGSLIIGTTIEYNPSSSPRLSVYSAESQDKDTQSSATSTVAVRTTPSSGQSATMAISEVTVTNTTAMITWMYLDPSQVTEISRPMVRYVPLSHDGQPKTKFILKLVVPGLSSLLVEGLTPATTYGFQVAPLQTVLGSSTPFPTTPQWSEMARITTKL